MDTWNSVVGDDSLFCEKEVDKEYDANAAAVVHIILVEKRVVGHLSKLLSKTIAMFLSLPRPELHRKRVNWNRVNRGARRYLAFTNSVAIRKLFLGMKRKDS